MHITGTPLRAIFVAVLILILVLPTFCLIESASAAPIKYTLEGYTLDPKEKWTTGAIKGWSEGECIPFRYTVTNSGSNPESLHLNIIFDSEKDGIVGVESFEAFQIPAGTIEGPIFDGEVNGWYTWDVIVPRGSTYILEWCAQLGFESGLWPGASIHVSAKNGGSMDVPIMVGDLETPDVYVTKTASSSCGEIRYTIQYGNWGKIDQTRTVLVAYYDAEQVFVIDSSGGLDDGNSIAWQIGDLASGTVESLSYVMAIKYQVLPGTSIASNAFISGDLAERSTKDNSCEVVAYAKLLPRVNAGLEKTILEGESTGLGGNPIVVGSFGNYTTLWTPAYGLDDPAKPNPTASPGKTTTYVVKVTDANGCSNQDEVMVNVLSNPFCQIEGPGSICENSHVATFYYVGEDTSMADFGFIWSIDGVVVGNDEAIDVDFSHFGFGQHSLILDVFKTYPSGEVTYNRCVHPITYIESPKVSITVSG